MRGGACRTRISTRLPLLLMTCNPTSLQTYEVRVCFSVVSRIRARPHELFDCAEWMDSDGGGWGKDAGDSSASVHGSSGEIETKTLLYLLAQGRVAVKAVVPRDPSSLIDKFIQVSEQQPAPASSQDYIPYWVQVRWRSKMTPDARKSAAVSVICVKRRQGARSGVCVADRGAWGMAVVAFSHGASR